MSSVSFIIRKNRYRHKKILSFNFIAVADYNIKTLPVIIDNMIYSTESQIKYMNYWEEKSKKLKKHIDSLEYINSLEVVIS